MNYQEIIDHAQAILKPLASLYKPFSICYYITISDSSIPIKKDDYLVETGSCEDFCEYCIDSAFKNYKDEFYLERAQLLFQIAQVKEFGYYTIKCLLEYKPTDSEIITNIHDGRSLIKVNIPPGTRISQLRIYSKLKKEYRKHTIFGIRADGDPQASSGFKICDCCGELFDCFHMDEQEIEHWEQYGEFNINDMDSHFAFELYTIFDYWNEEDDLKERSAALAQKVITDSIPADERSVARDARYLNWTLLPNSNSIKL